MQFSISWYWFWTHIKIEQKEELWSLNIKQSEATRWTKKTKEHWNLIRSTIETCSLWSLLVWTGFQRAMVILSHRQIMCHQIGTCLRLEHNSTSETSCTVLICWISSSVRHHYVKYVDLVLTGGNVFLHVCCFLCGSFKLWRHL